MSEFFYSRKARFFKKIISSVVVLSFSLSLLTIPAATSQAQYISNLPAPGTLVLPSVAYQAPLLKGMTLDLKNPLHFNFLVDIGQDRLSGEPLKKETEKLIKFYLAALTTPDDESWVNLSPYENDRIIPDPLAATEMGKVMLEQDYLLKQLSASLTSPNTETGKKFWDTVYKRAHEKFGTMNVPINTFNKVWIVPDKAELLEDERGVYIGPTRLKVMMDQDYLSIKENLNSKHFGTDQVAPDQVEQISELSAQVVKEIIIPELEKEVNEGKTFAPTRQIYNSVVLAVWYKDALKESLLGKVYVDKKKMAGVETNEKDVKQKVYDQYLAAFRKGVYNLIKEDYDLSTKETLPRKYFSGGLEIQKNVRAAMQLRRWDDEQAAAAIVERLGNQLPRDTNGRVSTGGIQRIIAPLPQLLDKQPDAVLVLADTIARIANGDIVVASSVFSESHSEVGTILNAARTAPASSPRAASGVSWTDFENRLRELGLGNNVTGISQLIGLLSISTVERVGDSGTIKKVSRIYTGKLHNALEEGSGRFGKSQLIMDAIYNIDSFLSNQGNGKLIDENNYLVVTEEPTPEELAEFLDSSQARGPTTMPATTEAVVLSVQDNSTAQELVDFAKSNANLSVRLMTTMVGEINGIVAAPLNAAEKVNRVNSTFYNIRDDAVYEQLRAVFRGLVAGDEANAPARFAAIIQQAITGVNGDTGVSSSTVSPAITPEFEKQVSGLVDALIANRATPERPTQGEIGVLSALKRAFNYNRDKRAADIKPGFYTLSPGEIRLSDNQLANQVSEIANRILGLGLSGDLENIAIANKRAEYLLYQLIMEIDRFDPYKPIIASSAAGEKSRLQSNLASILGETLGRAIPMPTGDPTVADVLSPLVADYFAQTDAKKREEIEKQINGIIDQVNVLQGTNPANWQLVEPFSLDNFKSQQEYQRYLGQAIEAMVNGVYVPQFLFAGAATRFGGRPMYDLVLDGIEEMSGVDIKHSLGMGPRQLIAYVMFLHDLAVKANRDPAQVMRNQRIVLNINGAVEETLIRDLLARDFYGFDPANVFIVVQPLDSGFRLENGQLVEDRTLALIPSGHGFNAMQLGETSEAYTLDRSGQRNMLQGQSVFDVLGDSALISSHRINDLTKFSVEEVANLDKLAQSLYLLDQGYNMAVELVENPLGTKGGNAVREGDRSFLVETSNTKGSAAMTAFLNKAGENKAPYNAFRILQRVSTARELYRELPFNLRFKDGLRLEAVTGDATQVASARPAFFSKPGETIKDLKERSPAHIALAREAIEKQDQEIKARSSQAYLSRIVASSAAVSETANRLIRNLRQRVDREWAVTGYLLSDAISSDRSPLLLNSDRNYELDIAAVRQLAGYADFANSDKDFFNGSFLLPMVEGTGVRIINAQDEQERSSLQAAADRASSGVNVAVDVDVINFARVTTENDLSGIADFTATDFNLILTAEFLSLIEENPERFADFIGSVRGLPSAVSQEFNTLFGELRSAPAARLLGDQKSKTEYAESIAKAMLRNDAIRSALRDLRRNRYPYDTSSLPQPWDVAQVQINSKRINILGVGHLVGPTANIDHVHDSYLVWLEDKANLEKRNLFLRNFLDFMRVNRERLESLLQNVDIVRKAVQQEGIRKIFVEQDSQQPFVLDPEESQRRRRVLDFFVNNLAQALSVNKADKGAMLEVRKMAEQYHAYSVDDAVKFADALDPTLLRDVQIVPIDDQQLMVKSGQAQAKFNEGNYKFFQGLSADLSSQISAIQFEFLFYRKSTEGDSVMRIEKILRDNKLGYLIPLHQEAMRAHDEAIDYDYNQRDNNFAANIRANHAANEGGLVIFGESHSENVASRLQSAGLPVNIVDRNAGYEVPSIPIQAAATPVGGIDFDPRMLNLQIKRDGRGVPLPLPQQNIEQINIEGLFPVILNIQPATIQSLPFLLSRPLDDQQPIGQLSLN